MRRMLGFSGVLTLVLVLLGAMIGLGTYTFTYGEGFSYFSTEPEACVNCHIMRPQYDSWLKSSHHHVAGCVDCHLPAHGIEKYIAKGRNGFNHSWAFTFQDFHEPIQITRPNAEILHDSCVRCHQPVVEQMGLAHAQGLESVSCVHCHATVGHGPVK